MDKDLIRDVLNERTERSGFPTQKEIADFLAQYFPKETEEQRLFNDHWGLYSKKPESIVKRVLMCTTPGSEVVNYFKKNKYDLLISHHDMLHHSGIPQIIYHSTMDVNQKGHNMYFVRKMGLRNFRQLHAVAVEGDIYKPLTLEEFKQYLEKHGFEIKGLVWENKHADDKIQSVMYCSGLGGYLIGRNHIVDVSNHPADVYVTGELMTNPNNTPNKFKYIIELSHTTSEKPLFKWLKTRLANRWQNLEIDLAPADIDTVGSESYKNKQDQQAKWDQEAAERKAAWEKEMKDNPEKFRGRGGSMGPYSMRMLGDISDEELFPIGGFDDDFTTFDPKRSDNELVIVLDEMGFPLEKLEDIEIKMSHLHYVFDEQEANEIVDDIEGIIGDTDQGALDEVQSYIDELRGYFQQ